ncbi:MAG: putative dsRNA-binding protein [Patescibacteria group bacterium]
MYRYSAPVPSNDGINARNFTVDIYLNDEHVASGEGMSKQEAQMAAAEKGLEAKGWK